MIIGIKKIIKDEDIKNLTYKEINELDSINSEKRKIEKSFHMVLLKTC